MAIIFKAVGWLMLVAALSVFAMRLQHAGPYFPPQGGNLLAALLALALGCWLVRAWVANPKTSRVLNWLALSASLPVLFFALYATLAELEEVIVLYAPNTSGQPVKLRLWVVDYDGAAWATMPRSKADANGLDNIELKMLRKGVIECVSANRFEDRESVNRAHQLRQEKYLVQRLATVVGVFGSEAGENTVTLRLDSC
ncbi:MAG: hypothetical protein ACI9JM_001716 [Halioglobus sp.]|jgi:hypothetical protein